MSSRINDLAPDVIPKAEAFIAALKAQSIPFFVSSTLRTEAEQVALFAQGREGLEAVNAKRIAAGMSLLAPSENTYTVTNCDGVTLKSRHQSGRALDIVPAIKGLPVWPPTTDPRWQRIGQVGQAMGFDWGGTWTKFPDFPHYEMPV